jgi:5-methyltetrahydropteroyltriglutamate--homocysteine methyltransferase
MPLFRAEQVGSLLRPARLVEARARRACGEIDAAALRAVEDECIAEAVRRQEEIGFAVVTDGEFRRENWWIDFVRALSGVEIRAGANPSFVRRGDSDYRYVPLSVSTTAKLGRKGDILLRDFTMLRAATRATPKITLPSPSRLHFHGGRESVSSLVYPRIDDFFDDVAAIYRAEIAALEEAGCRTIQIDDPLMSYFIGEGMRAQVRAEGEEPEARLALYIRLINACIAERRPDTCIGIHICRGNARSGWMVEGGYEKIAEAAFGGLAVDSFFLEYDDARSGDFAPLRFMPKDRHVVLGLVTTKFPELESKNALKRRIDEATRYVDLERLSVSPQCGFASSWEGNLITEETQWAKLALVVETAREVWGSA